MPRLLCRGLPFLLTAILVSACSPDPTPHPRIELTGRAMGATYSVTLVNAPTDLDRTALQQAIDARLADINRQMSTYDPASELSRFNRQHATDWFPVSPAVVQVVAEAERISRLSDGAFDITVGPLVDLWGFGPGETGNAIPDDRQIEQARSLVGHEKLRLRNDPPALRKTVPGLRIDLSAIAKGYAVDELSRLLSRRGLDRHLVEIGGELRARGHNAANRPWRIGVERPGPGFHIVHAAIGLRDQGMATSGDYRNFFERDGQRYSHTMEPTDGKPVTHALASVTVVADACMRADALATALLATGPERGYRLAEREGIAALFIERTNNGFIDRATATMQGLMAGVSEVEELAADERR